MNPNSDSFLSTRRQAIFQRILARNAGKGVVLDDPVFLRLIEAWIAGEIKMKEAAAHWNSVRLSRVAERRGITAVTSSEPSLPASFLSEERIDKEIDSGVGSLDEPEWIRAMSARKRTR